MKAKYLRDQLKSISYDLNHIHISHDEALLKLRELIGSNDTGAKEFLKKTDLVPSYMKDNVMWEVDFNKLCKVFEAYAQSSTPNKEAIPTEDVLLELERDYFKAIHSGQDFPNPMVYVKIWFRKRLKTGTPNRKGLDLDELERKLDKALDGETPESSKEWLKEQRTPKEREVIKLAPYQKKPSGRGYITWEAHLKAFETYSQKYRSQTAERIADRGGFGEYELDMFYPDWRNHIKRNTGTPNTEEGMGKECSVNHCSEIRVSYNYCKEHTEAMAKF